MPTALLHMLSYTNTLKHICRPTHVIVYDKCEYNQNYDRKSPHRNVQYSFPDLMLPLYTHRALCQFYDNNWLIFNFLQFDIKYISIYDEVLKNI